VGAVNVAAVAERTHGLCAFGTSISTVEFYDPRSKGRVAVLGGQDGEVTALDYSEDGLSLALGTSTGQIRVFDLRNPRPLLKKDQGMGLPIRNLIRMKTPTEERKLLSADKRIIKIWDEQTGDLWTSVEPLVDINFVTHVPESGMILTANEVCLPLVPQSFKTQHGYVNNPITGQAYALLLYSQPRPRAKVVPLLGQPGTRNGE
jgi:ribosome biogenesis protein ENP2